MLRNRLYDREREVVRFLAMSRGSKGVADIVGISVMTIKAHMAKIMLKLGGHTLARRVLDEVHRRLIDMQTG